MEPKTGIFRDRGVVMSSLNNDSSTLPNGNVIGEEIKLGILQNGKLYELNPATILLNFKAFPTGDTLKLCYGIYRPGWKDKPLPELQFEVVAGGRISKTVETRETTAEYPCETFALPDDFKWVLVTEKAHGYKVSYDKNGNYKLIP